MFLEHISRYHTNSIRLHIDGTALTVSVRLASPSTHPENWPLLVRYGQSRYACRHRAISLLHTNRCMSSIHGLREEDGGAATGGITEIFVSNKKQPLIWLAERQRPPRTGGAGNARGHLGRTGGEGGGRCKSAMHVDISQQKARFIGVNLRVHGDKGSVDVSLMKSEGCVNPRIVQPTRSRHHRACLGIDRAALERNSEFCRDHLAFSNDAPRLPSQLLRVMP